LTGATKQFLDGVSHRIYFPSSGMGRVAALSSPDISTPEHFHNPHWGVERLMRGSLAGFGTRSGYGSLKGALKLVGSLNWVGTLLLVGSLVHEGTLRAPGSLSSLGTLSSIGSNAQKKFSSN